MHKWLPGQQVFDEPALGRRNAWYVFDPMARACGQQIHGTTQ
jgi:hypothetical protein